MATSRNKVNYQQQQQFGRPHTVVMVRYYCIIFKTPASRTLEMQLHKTSKSQNKLYCRLLQRCSVRRLFQPQCSNLSRGVNCCIKMSPFARNFAPEAAIVPRLSSCTVFHRITYSKHFETAYIAAVVVATRCNAGTTIDCKLRYFNRPHWNFISVWTIHCSNAAASVSSLPTFRNIPILHIVLLQHADFYWHVVHRHYTWRAVPSMHPAKVV